MVAIAKFYDKLALAIRGCELSRGVSVIIVVAVVAMVCLSLAWSPPMFVDVVLFLCRLRSDCLGLYFVTATVVSLYCHYKKNKTR